MCYEDLLHDADMMGLSVKEIHFESDAKGLCKGKKIGIRKNMSDTEKACVLAEEIGHYFTSVGNILDQDCVGNRKQENYARKWAVDKMIKIEDLFRAVDTGCQTLFDIAEYLEVTEAFLLEALGVFKKRHGLSYTHENRTITFLDNGFCIQ